MPAKRKVTEWTPITPRGGGLVHATSMETPRRTVCKRPCDGWRVAPLPMTCPDCAAGVHLPVKRRRK